MSRIRPYSAVLGGARSSANGTARRATAPCFTPGHSPLPQSKAATVTQAGALLSLGFVFTSDALAVNFHQRQREHTDFKAEGETFVSDAFGDGYLHPDLVFSHLPKPMGWYHICNAPAAAGSKVERNFDNDIRRVGVVDVLCKLKGLLGIAKNQRSVAAGANSRSAEEDRNGEAVVPIQGSEVLSGLGMPSDGKCVNGDEDGHECLEDWRKRDARRYGLFGTFELEGGRSS